MRIIKCSGAIFVEDTGKILLEDRRKFSKHGEHWSFFGGHAEKGETKIQTLQREIKEELHYRIIDYKHFKDYTFRVRDIKLTYYMYIAPMPEMNKIKVHKGAKAKKFTIKQALRLKMINMDKKILIDVKKVMQNRK